MALHRLNKVVIKVTQNDGAFDNICANTKDAFENCVLDKAGRIVAAFHQKHIDGKTLLIVIEQSALQPLSQHMRPYLALGSIRFSLQRLIAYWDLDNSCEPNAQDRILPQKEGRIILSEEEIPCDADSDQFTVFRLKHNIPLQYVDYQKELALNVSYDLVSLTKGCYPGQEVIARVHNLAKPPKRLIVVDLDGLEPIKRSQATSVAVIDGKTKGFLFVPNT